MGIVNVSSLSTIANAGTCTAASYSVTTTSGNALAANASRKRALLLNPPSNTSTIYLQFGAAATTSTGLPLAPGQGWIEESNLIYQGAFTAIVASGTAPMLTYEWA